MHKKFVEDRICSPGDMIAVRQTQTNKQPDGQTLSSQNPPPPVPYNTDAIAQKAELQAKGRTKSIVSEKSRQRDFFLRDI